MGNSSNKDAKYNYKVRNILYDEGLSPKTYSDILSLSLSKKREQEKLVKSFVEEEEVQSTLTKGMLSRPEYDYNIKYVTQAITHFMPVIQASNLVAKAPDLSAIIECYANSISGAGWYAEYIGKEGEQGSKQAVKEKENLEFRIRNINYKETINDILYKQIRDKETIAYAFLEVRRNANGEVAELNHIPSSEILIYREELDPQRVKVYDYEGPTTKSKYHYHYFKQFVRFPNITSVHLGTPIYYKEFGSNTPLSRSGEIYESNDAIEKSGHVVADEIIYFELYHTGLFTAIPRWASALEGINGTFLADELNRDSLENGGRPDMALLVSGGGLDQESLDEISRSFNGPSRNKKKVIVLEAIGDDMAASDNGQIPPPKIEFKALHDERQQDALYQEYIRSISDRLLSAYRLNPMMLGRIQDVNYSTAEQAILLIEEQVFKPERRKLEAVINRFVLASGKKQTPMRYWRFRLKPTVFMTPSSIMSLLRAGEVAGAMTPNTGIEIINKHTELSIEKVKEAWGDYPKDFTAIAASQQREIGLEEIMSPPIDASMGVRIDNKAGGGQGMATSKTKPSSGNSDGQVNSVNELLNDVQTSGNVNTNNLSLKKYLQNKQDLLKSIENDLNEIN